jgi:hypothetical protein
MDKWTSFPMYKAWRHFICLRLYRDEHVLQNIARVQDPDAMERVDHLNNSGNDSF